MSFQTRYIADIIKKSNVSFGTSGARGLVADFDQHVCSAFVQSFFHLMKKKYYFTHVALAIDNRPSSYLIAQYCASALSVLGVTIIFYGVIPTPALAYQAKIDKVPCIMITGSHIPFDRNGMKFYTPNGEITKEDEINILDCKEPLLSSDKQGLVINNAAAERYINRYVSLYNNTPLTGRTIGIYEHSSSGRDLYSTIFSKLGANTISLGRSDNFVPIDTEAVTDEDRIRAKLWSQEYKLDAIFSTDGDGDRPLLADENGEWLRGDILGILCSKALSVKKIAVPVNCNTAIEKTEYFHEVIRTKIGSPYVLEAMSNMAKKGGVVAGFEANGGFLLGSDIHYNHGTLSALPTRDAVLPAIIVLVESLSRSTVSKCVKALPERFTYSDRITEYPLEKSNKLIRFIISSPPCFIRKIGVRNFLVSSINQLDGVRIISTNGDIIHLRPSGNAPELRCYAEASTAEKAKGYVIAVFDSIKLI